MYIMHIWPSLEVVDTKPYLLKETSHFYICSEFPVQTLNFLNSIGLPQWQGLCRRNVLI